MGRRKASEEPKPEMKKPKWKIGEIVVYNFLGTLYEGKILDLKKNPQNIERWVYSIQNTTSNIKVPYVGIEGSEKFANIYFENN